MRVAVIDDGVHYNHFEYEPDNGFDAFQGAFPDDDAFHPFGNDTHGTSIGGIITGKQNNNQGGSGVAPLVRLHAVRIFRNSYPPGLPQAATNGQIGDGIRWATLGSDVLNNSWGGGLPSNAITTAINDATTNGRGGKGAVVVFSVGNDSDRDNDIVGNILYPATLASVIAVGAINRNGNITNYSNEGTDARRIDVVAPSGHYTDFCVGEVVTTDLPGNPGCSDYDSEGNSSVDYTETFSGTSAAAPQVAGVAALIISREPGLTGAAVKQRILDNTDYWGGPERQFGRGKLNAYRAVNPPAPPPPPFSVSIVGPSSLEPGGSCSWFASASGGSGTYSTYAWTADGNPVGNNSNVLNYTMGMTGVTFGVTVTDSDDRTAFSSAFVDVEPGAYCF